jgi:uncharacterized protein YegL
MRRLPIYFLVDTCLSMSGKPIEMVENCINGALKILKSNPQAHETNVISVIAFGNNKVSFLETYKWLNEIDNQKFNCSGYSNINYGLEAVKDDYNKNFIKTTTEKKGDWKPMLFVFSGVAPNTKIDNFLIDFFEKKFSNGYLDYIESFVGEEFENISDKANYTFIVTSENEFAKNSFENYFANVFSYEDIDSFVYKFNNFFKWIS